MLTLTQVDLELLDDALEKLADRTDHELELVTHEARRGYDIDLRPYHDELEHIDKLRRRLRDLWDMPPKELPAKWWEDL